MNERNYIKHILTVKDYKLTLNSLFEEEKLDRPKKKSRYFVDLIHTAIQMNDFDSLLKIWKDYEILYFKFLDFDKQRTADIMKSDLYKTFLIECFKNKKIDKINSFFLTMGSYMLSNKMEWDDWFEFPFVKNPSEHKVFALYFSRLWIDNFFLSMFNFFMQVVRSVMSNESDLEKFFSIDMRLDNVLNQLTSNEIESVKQKYNLPDCTTEKNQVIDQIFSCINYTPRNLHDVSDLLCDFRLTRENRQLEYKKLSKTARPKGITHIIQNKSKSTSPNTFLRKKPIINVNNDNIDIKDNLVKINEDTPPKSPIRDNEHDPSTLLPDENANLAVTMAVNPGLFILPDTKNASIDSFGIKLLSNKISQKIFRPKSNTFSEMSKPTIHHEHFSMVTHVKFGRMPSPKWASLDVGGTFKIWSTNELSAKSIHTLSFKHTIYSFDWLSCTLDLILLGTKGGSVKLFDIASNEIIQEMAIDSLYPRINIIQSFENEARFVCECLNRSRSTLSSTSLPQGTVSLYDAESWSSIRTNLIILNSEFTVNCINCAANTIVAGCSNGSVQLIDVRLPNDPIFTSLSVFVDDEVVNVVGMSQTKWTKPSMDSNYLICLNSKSHLKMFDIRQSSKPVCQDMSHLTDLNMPLSWAERPSGGEQTIYFPRANLISTAFLNNGLLFSATKKGILMHKINNSNLSDPVTLNAGHNSPVICLDSSPTDLTDRNNAIVLSGSMEGTISTLKINNK